MKTPKRSQKKLTLGPHNAQFQGLVKTTTGGFRLRFLVLDSKIHDTECIATLKVYTKAEINKLFGGNAENFLNKHFEIVLAKNTYNELLTITSCKPKRFIVPEWFIKHQENWQGSKNGAKLSETKKKYLAERQEKDPRFKRTNELRDFQNKGIRGELPFEKYENIFGIDYHGLRSYIESTFQKGFTWANRGSVWQLDHKVPLTAFDLFNKSEIKKALHYSNLQALSKEENIKKYNKIEVPETKPLSLADRIEQYYAENGDHPTK
jgi:hypothetical protein